MAIRISRRWARRLAVPVLSLLITAGAAVGALYWLSEAQVNVVDVSRETRRNISDLRTRIENLRQRADYMAAFRKIYDRARDGGFLSDQDRLDAGDTIESLAVDHALDRATYTFEKARRFPLDEDADEVDRSAGSVQAAATPENELVVTTIRLTLDAGREAELFEFIDSIRDELPGYVVLRSLELTREVRDLSPALAQLREGGHPTIIRGLAELEWLTLSLRPEDKESGAPDA